MRYAAIKGQLDERGRRLFVAAEKTAAGNGGTAAVSRATGVARSTIICGAKDLLVALLSTVRIRRRRAGRRPSSKVEQIHAKSDAEPRERLHPQNRAERQDRGGDCRHCMAGGEPHREGIRLIGSQREQNQFDRGPDDCPGKGRPAGDDPEQRDGVGRDERTPGIDQSQWQIGHAQADDARTRHRPNTRPLSACVRPMGASTALSRSGAPRSAGIAANCRDAASEFRCSLIVPACHAAANSVLLHYQCKAWAAARTASAHPTEARSLRPAARRCNL